MQCSKRLGRIQEAIDGSFGEDQCRIALEGAACIETLLKKNHDYGCSIWKPPVLAPDLDPDSAIRVRMSDKIQRLQALLSPAQPGQQVLEESIADTIRDLVGYGILWLAMPKEPKGAVSRSRLAELLYAASDSEGKNHALDR